MSNNLAETLARKSARAKKAAPDPTAAKKSSGGRWDDNNRRASFYLSNDLIDDLDTAAKERGMTKSQIVTAALNEWLNQ